VPLENLGLWKLKTESWHTQDYISYFLWVFYYNATLLDNLLGFQIEKSEEWEYSRTGLCLGKPIAQSAKSALDLALSLS
jgi:hypothetical protein